MKRPNLKKLYLWMTLFCGIANAVFSQTYVNREWSTPFGSPVLLQWTQSIRLNGGKMATVGNTAVAGQGTNILLSVYKADGTLHWSSNYNTSGTYNDYGSNLVEDANGNIYVCGMTDNGGITNIDMVVLKYTSGGSLVWNATYNSPFSKNDIASSLAVDGNLNVYVTGVSEGDTTQYDYITLGLGSNGTLNWASRYDYASLPEYAIGIVVDNNSSVIVTGASASSSSNWDYTTIRYTLAGVQSSVNRNNIAGSGYDQPYAYIKDNNGNIYLTGKGSTNGTDYDIKTLKLKSNLDLSWNVVYAGNGYYDQANAIALDQNQNVVVGGYETNGGGEKEAKLIKYDNSGSQLWEYNRHSDYATGDAEIKAIDIDTANANEIYILIENTGFNNTKDLALLKLNEDGNVLWERTIQSSKNEIATAVKYYPDESIWITYVQELGAVRNYTVEKYTDYTTPNYTDNDTNGRPLQMKNELVIRFNESALNYDAIDNNIGSALIEYNDLSYFLKQAESNILYTKLQSLCSEDPEVPAKIICAKIFNDLNTNFKKTVNRLGDTIKIPNFWACLRVIFPNGTDKQAVIDSLNSIPQIVVYAEPNFIPYPYAAFNDPSFQYQYGFYPSLQFPNSDVNIVGAWDYTTGNSNVKICITDDGMYIDHNEFKNGPNNNSSKVAGKYDHIVKSPNLSPVGGEHGTKVAGIIGAQTNNAIGVSGICGGSYTNVWDNGARLYVNRITNFNTVPITYAYKAIVDASIDSAGSLTKWGVHIMNNSYGLQVGGFWYTNVDTNFQLLKEASHFANRANVTFVAARGNFGNTARTYPATSDEDWIINVGGSGMDGNYSTGYWIYPPSNPFGVYLPGASIGHNIDVVAPYRSGSTYTTYMPSISTPEYGSFDGTSAAAAYVSGVAGLLMSYLNEPIPSYKNLAPEDVEHILEYSATDIDSLYYDEKTGHGRLNAGAAFELVSKPKHQVMHFGTNSNSTFTKQISQESLGDTIKNLEYYNTTVDTIWYKPGKYIVDRFRIDAQVNHNLNIVDTIFRYWCRTSSSTLLEGVNANGELLARERIKIDSMNNTYAKLHGYVYKVYDSLGNYITWWPFDTTDLSKAKFEYTLLTFNGSSTSINERNENLSINVYPNPSRDGQIISFEYSSIDQLSIDLYDMSGRKIANVFEGKTKIGMNRVKNQIENLPSGIYFYQIQINETKYIRKITKL
jgi:hypothetical protein